MERFVIIVSGFKPLTIITKRSILDVAAVLGPPLEAACNAYSMMIVPMIIYSSTLRIPYTYTQYNKLESLSRGASSIIKCNDNLPSINTLVNRDICLLVKKCLLKDLSSGTFGNYLILQKHNKNTRNNNHSIRLPRVKLELVRQSFSFYGGKLYNELPIGIRKLDTISELKVVLRGHFL